MNEMATLPASQINFNSESNDSPIIDNINSMELKKTYNCTYSGCSAVFSKPSKLVIHIRQHTGERPYKCDHDGCGKSYTNSSHLKRHSQTHNMVKQSFKCHKCSLMISNRQNLKRHYDRIHSENSTFFCKECDLRFSKELKYKEHEAIHKGIALYECKICSRQYTTLSTFKKHERSHNNIKEYPCTAPNCSEVFSKWSLLCKHKNSKHINEYKCKDCDRVFLNKAQLKSHFSIHADNRSILPCPYEKCPRFYFFKRNLDHHVRTNHLGKKYHCDICDMKLSSKQKILEHINKIHLAKKKKRKKKKTLGESEQRKRNDAGTTKKSMLSQLVGLDLPRKIEKELLNRKTRILIENPVQISKEIVENGKEIKVLDQELIVGSKNVINNYGENLSVTEADKKQVIHEFSDQIDQQRLTNTVQ